LRESPAVRVLVTGATGFVGSWVARELVSRGHVVRVLVRRTSKLANLETLPLERAEGDVTDRASVERALDGCEGVMYAAGVVGFRPADAERQYAVNAGGVEVVFSAALGAGVKRAVLTSSVAVMGGSPSPRVIDETSGGNAEELGIDYMVSKLRGERAALRLAERGLPVCAVRPAVVLGPGDVYRSSATLVLALARRQLPLYVRGGSSFCDVRDVASGHAEALARGRPGQAYILGGHNLVTDELIRRVSGATGVPPPRRVPRMLALATAAAAEAVARLRGAEARLSPQLVRASSLYTFVSSAKAMAELSYCIRPFEESLADTLRWFIAQGRLRPTTPQLRALAD
jgi:dihydroflavonol-4-reductase